MIEGEGLSWGEGAGETMNFGATCMNLVCTVAPWLSDIIVPIGIIRLLRGRLSVIIFPFLYNIEILFFLVYCLSHSPFSPSLSLSFHQLSLTATGVWILGCKGRLSRLRQAVSRRYLVGSGGNLCQRRLRAKETHAPSLSAGYVYVRVV